MDKSLKKVAIDAREMVGSVAGKGRYVAEIVKALGDLTPDIEYILYTKEPVTQTLPKNLTNVLIGGLPGLRQLWLARDAERRGCQLTLSPTGYLPVLFSLIPAVVVVHDLAPFVCKEARPALRTLLAERLLLGATVRKARRIIAVSQSTKTDLQRVFHLDTKKIDVTLLGYDRHAYQPKPQPGDAALRKKYSITGEYLLFVGTLEPRKNIVGLIQAYAQLPETLRKDYPLLIGGKKGWHYDNIFTTVKELKLEDSVSFLGRVPDEDLPGLYRQATLFLFPSFYEGFGLPPLEAMACGTPVVSSTISSLPEVIGQAGHLVDPHDTKALAQAIASLLSDPAARDSAKAAAITQAQKFSWQQAAQDTSQALQRALKK